MEVTGRCHCGAIAYRGVADPAKVTLCHCTDCQALTGSAYRISVPVPAESFKLLSGTPKVYIKTAESGAKRAHSFCPNCGTPVFASAIENPTSYTLRVGNLDQRASLGPKRRIWWKSAMPWSENIAALPKQDRQ